MFEMKSYIKFFLICMILLNTSSIVISISNTANSDNRSFIISSMSSITAGVNTSYIATYSFNTNFQNTLGTGFNGAPHGNIYLFPSFSGKAAVFDGSTCYVDTGIDLTKYSQFSISVWFNEGGKSSRQQILAQDSIGDRVITLEYDPNKPTGTQFYSYDGSITIQPSTSSGITITSGAWYNAVITHSNSSYDLYLDGALIAHGVGHSYNPSSITLRIGDRQYATSVDNFNGQIDEVDVYSSVLSSSVIKTQFTNIINAVTTNASGNLNTNNSYFNIIFDSLLVIIGLIGVGSIFMLRKSRKDLAKLPSNVVSQSTLNHGRVENMRNRGYFCLKCSTPLEIHDKFCPTCGTPVITVEK